MVCAAAGDGNLETVSEETSWKPLPFLITHRHKHTNHPLEFRVSLLFPQQD